MPIRIGLVVEGTGDVEAAPLFARRVGLATRVTTYIHIPTPVRVPRSRLIKDGELERAIELAAAKVDGEGGVIVLIDADDDCPAELGPVLLARAASAARGRFPVAVALARSEFESWFIAGIVSLRGARSLRNDVQPVAEPELIRDAKGWLAKNMARGYSEVLDQPAFASEVDIAAARAGSDSCNKFCRELERLIDELRR